MMQTLYKAGEPVPEHLFKLKNLKLDVFGCDCLLIEDETKTVIKAVGKGRYMIGVIAPYNNVDMEINSTVTLDCGEAVAFFNVGSK